MSIPLSKIREDGTPAGGAPGMAANTTGDSPNMSMPPNSGGMMRRYKQFDVEPELFRKFQTGRVKFERWSNYLNMEDAGHKEIYNYARSGRGLVVLRDKSSGALRAIRHRSANGV